MFFSFSLPVRLVRYYYFSFFFQAEDGIRYAQESRGLGDVYKRQPMAREAVRRALAGLPGVERVTAAGSGEEVLARYPVSYTHLTLPTIYSV